MSKIQVNDIVNHFDDGAPNFPKGIVVGSGATLGFNVGTGASIYSPSDNVLTLGTNNSERLRIHSDGSVGIGTNNPQSFNSDGRNLVIGTGSGGQGMSIYSGNSSYGTIYFADGTSGDQLYPGGILYNHNTDFLRFDTAGSEKLRITSGGKLKARSTHSNSAVNEALRITTTGTYSGTNSENSGPAIAFGQFDAQYPTWTTAQIAGIRKGTNWDGALVFYTNSGSSETDISEKLRITSAGISQFQATDRVATFTGNGIEINNSLGSNVFIGTQSGTEGKIGTVNNANMSLFANNDYSKRAELQTSGSFSILDGNLIVANSHGINFGSTTPDGTTPSSELLDDYEEGTWTPSIQNYTSSVTSTVTNTTGHYSKVGNIVTVTWYSSTMSLSGSQSGAAQIGGLPFVSINATNVYQSAVFSHINCCNHVINSGYTVANETRLVLIQNNSTSTTTWNTSGGNRYLMMQLTYLTNT